MDLSKYLSMFLDEGREHLAQMQRILDIIERGEQSADSITAFFRHCHSLKGMAATMGFDGTMRLAHALEARLGDLRADPAGAGAIAGLLRQGVDRLEGLLEHVARDGQEGQGVDDIVDALKAPSGAAPSSAPPPPAAPPSVPPSAPAGDGSASAQNGSPSVAVTVRVTISAESGLPAARALIVQKTAKDHGRVASCEPAMDKILGGDFNGLLVLNMEGVSDPATLREAIARMPDVVRVEIEGDAVHAAVKKENTAGAPADRITSLRVPVEQIDLLVDQAEEALVVLNQLDDSLPRDDRDLSRQRLVRRLANHLQGLYLGARTLRLLPFEIVTARLHRGFRDTARKLGRKARLDVDGESELLDRSILEGLTDPLNHLLRNALDHGIEAPDARSASGKAAEGSVRLCVRRSGEALVVSVSDDGAGIDPEDLVRSAIRKGFLDENRARSLSPAEKLLLIALPGFSTRDDVSEISGRGVGMDVVRDQVEALGGALVIQSEIGKGTTFQLSFPNTIQLVPSLVFRDGESPYALPLASVEKTVLGRGARIDRTAEGPVLLEEDDVIPICSMPWSADAEPEEMDYFVVQSGGRRAAIGVLAILGHETLLYRTLGKPLESHPAYLGAAIRGAGDVVMILNPEAWIP